MASVVSEGGRGAEPRGALVVCVRASLYGSPSFLGSFFRGSRNGVYVRFLRNSRPIFSRRTILIGSIFLFRLPAAAAAAADEALLLGEVGLR